MIQPAVRDVISSRSSFLCHAAAWYGLLFATPLFIALTNPRDVLIPLPLLAACLLVLFLLSSVTSWWLGRRFGPKAEKYLAASMLAAAFVLAFQANILHSLTYFGQFDGSIVDFRIYGHYFWLEWMAFLFTIPLLTWLFTRAGKLNGWLPWIPLFSFTLMWFPAVMTTGKVSQPSAGADYDDSVFEFSNQRNLIHLLADGLQSDVVEQVLRENPKLAKKFNGFTLYANHLGAYHGTAPALPAMLTGQPFDFSRGHVYSWITPFINEHSYQNELVDKGYIVDQVTIDRAYCLNRANSCISRPFSDWKSRGYARTSSKDRWYSIRLLADLSLYRLSPSFLKEKIHNQGEWMFSDSSMDGASPWPDPVIREWVENMQVVNTPSQYKFYHYIGTHKPPFWDRRCQRQSSLPRTRENFLGQAECILTGLTLLLDKLNQEGILDQTAIIISGDHGHDIAPIDLSGEPEMIPLKATMMGNARPALMIKTPNSREPFAVSELPTSLFDIPGMILSISETGTTGFEATHFTGTPGEIRERLFFHYSVEKIRRFSQEPIPFDTFLVRGPVNEESSWTLADIVADHLAPEQFPLISFRTAHDYLRGARLNPALPDKELAWLDHKQFGFLFSVPSNWHSGVRIIFSMHLPEWIGEQTFHVNLNQELIGPEIKLFSSDRFWQDIQIELPGESLREGNNFMKLEFDHLVTSPSSVNLKAAALLQSIQIVPNESGE